MPLQYTLKRNIIILKDRDDQLEALRTNTRIASPAPVPPVAAGSTGMDGMPSDGVDANLPRNLRGCF